MSRGQISITQIKDLPPQPVALDATLDFGVEDHYVTALVSNASIHATSKIVVGITGEDAAIQNITVGLISVSEGEATIYGNAPDGASGTFTATLIVL